MDLKGKRAFIAGIGDDQGYGFAIAKALANLGCEILIGTWTPLMNIFSTAWKNGKFDQSRKLDDGTLMEYQALYAIDAAFDTPEDVPEEIRTNKRYKAFEGYTISEVAKRIEADYGKIDFMIHSLANGPEVKNPLLETSRQGYLSAMSSSAYSFVSLVKYFGPIMERGGAAVNLTYLASERAVPGYGGG